MKPLLALIAVLWMVVAFVPTTAMAQSQQDALRLHKEADALQEKARSNEDLKQAAQKHEEAVRIYNRVGDQKNAALVYNNLGAVYQGWGQYPKAVEYYEKSLMLSRKLGDVKTEGVTLNNLGDVYCDLGQYPKAVKFLEKSLAITRKLGDLKGEGQTLCNLGNVFNDWGQYQKAVEYYEKSLGLSRKVGDVKSEGVTLNNLGNVFKGWGQYPKAVEYYEKSLELSRKVGDLKGEGMTLNNLGNVFQHWGQYPKAVEYYEKSLGLSRKVGDVKTEGQTLTCLGVVYNDWGQYPKAVEYYEKSLELSRKVGDLKGEGQTLGNLGNVFNEWGQYPKAVELYEQSLAIKRKIGDVKSEGVTLNNLGTVYSLWGQYPKAVEYYEKSLELSRKVGDLKGEGSTLNNLGNVYKDWGQYQKAVELLEKALETARRIGSPSDEVYPLNNLGRVFEYRGDLAEALKAYEQGLEIYTRIKVPTAWPKDLIGNLYLEMGDLNKAESFIKQANYSSSLGRLCLAKSQYPQAKSHYEKVLTAAEKSKNINHLFTGYTGLGKACEALEEYEKAAEHYEKGMVLVEEIRSSLVPAQRANFFEVKVNGFLRSEPAQGLTRVRMKLGKDMAGIETSEATRARAFADGLAQRSAKGVPDSVLKQEEQLVIRIAVLKKNRSKIEEDKKPDVYDNLTRQITVVEKEHKEFVEMLRKKYPAYAAVKYPQPVPPKDSALLPEECVVMFDVSSEGVCVKLIRGKKVAQSFFTEWPGDNLQAKVRQFRKPFDELKPREFDPALGQMLYQRLLMPVLGQIPEGTPLIIVPQGALSVLPFEALVVSGTATWQSGAKGPYPTGITYLGDRHPISYYQSINALHLARTLQAKKPTGAKSLVIADPVFDTTDARAQKQSERKQASVWENLPDRLMSIEKETGLSFKRLELTEKLAKALKNLNPSNTDTLLGMDATKADLLKRGLDRYRNIVFATHGYFGTNLPGIQEPVLALTLVNQPKPDEGFLRMSEVMGLSLNADVVALTACQTGLGRNISGEGVMSMGRAFQYAGARSVLMSLWVVSEQASVNLVEAFFKHLKAGKSKLDALHSARADIRKDGYEHPYYWAPFILVGETQ